MLKNFVEGGIRNFPGASSHPGNAVCGSSENSAPADPNEQVAVLLKDELIWLVL